MLVVASGVFEILHPGHLTYLKRCREFGDRLVVVVASDETVVKRKRRPVVGQDQRLLMVKALKGVDDAVIGDPYDMYSTMVKLKPDIVALGPDQAFDESEIRRELASRGLGADVVRVTDYWDGGLHSTSEIVDLIKKQ